MARASIPLRISTEIKLLKLLTFHAIMFSIVFEIDSWDTYLFVRVNLVIYFAITKY